MDPNEAVAIANDGSRSTEERVQAIRDLGQWLARGGFAPTTLLRVPSGRTEDNGIHAHALMLVCVNMGALGDLRALRACGFEVTV